MSAHQRPPLRPLAAADARLRIACDVAWIDRDGVARRDIRLLPDTAAVTAAMALLPRGAMLRAEAGDVAIEDLRPGMRVAVHGGAFARVTWTGSRVHAGGGDLPVGYRVAARAFGPCGPAADIVVGASAHVLIASPRCRALVGGPLAFAPVAAFADGHAVTAIVPQGEVSTFGFACARQEAVSVGGLWLESIHAGCDALDGAGRDARADIARLLPLASAARSAPLRLPRLTLEQARQLAVEGLTRG